MEFLIEAGLRLNRPSLINEARILLANMRNKAQRNGSYNLTNPLGMASLYYGYAGIAMNF